MTKKIIAIAAFVIATVAFSIISYAASYSSAWYQSGGKWYIMGPNGQMVTNAWVNDNAAGPGSGDNWYLIEANGQMVTHPLVQDGTGNYYSLETAHNGNYGMMRHVSGVYDGVNLIFNQSHNGSFGAITNQDGINALMAKYGCYNVAHINNRNIIYTASYSSNQSSTTEKEYKINYYIDGSKWKTTTSSDDTIKVASYNSMLEYWYDDNSGEIYYPGQYYSFSGSKRTAKLVGVLSGQDPNAGQRVNQNEYTVNFYKMGSLYKSMSNYTGQFSVPSCSSVNGNSFAFWEDEYGNHWLPGEVYTSHSLYDTLQACYNEIDYGDDSEYYDDEY